MQDTKKIDISKISESVQNIGIEITLIESLINFLRLGILDNETHMKKADIANLTKVIKEKISYLKNDYDKLENSLDI